MTGSPADLNLGGRGGRRSPGAAGARLAELDELEIVVEKLVAGGEGLARFEGIPIFVPRSAPGDRLRVRLVDRRPDYGRAEIVEILEAGAGRRRPPCPHFGRCGGCDLQHLEDDLQVRVKADAVKETLVRLGGLRESPEIEIVSGPAWGYRTRTQVQTSMRGGHLDIGYRARRSRDIVAVDECPILVPELEQLVRLLPERLPLEAPQRIDLLAGDESAVSTAPATRSLPHGEVTVTVGEFEYELDARCFFQGHRQLLEDFVQRVIGAWTGDLAFDLYSGVGLLSLPLSRRYAHVTAVEVDRVAGRYARRNARRYRLRHVEFVTSAVESWIRKLPHGADRVVVDPPRPGLSRQVRKLLCERPCRRLTYASCHPAALARDLRQLCDVYRIESLTLLDMFPQTGHMEAVLQLVS